MSKATEWSIRHNSSENLRPELRLTYQNEYGREENDRLVATVTDYGCLHLRTSIIDASQALQLRDWLTETFDECE